MDVRQLRYFVAVAEELSFSRAARRLHVSQPPLSMQVKALEAELGTMLFARTRRSVRLTGAGEVLLEHGRRAIAALERAAEMTRRAGRGEAGQLSLGFTASVPLLDVFARVLGRFRACTPNAAVQVRLMSTGAQLHALTEGQLDVGILRPRRDFRPGPELVLRQVWEDRLFVFLPAGHRLLARNGAIAMGELAEERFVSFGRGLGCGLADELALLGAEAGFQPRIAQEVDVASSILGLVAAGEGVAILPECQMRAGIAGVSARPVSARPVSARPVSARPVSAQRVSGPPGDAMSRLMLAHRADQRSPLLRHFLAVAEEVLLAGEAAGGPAHTIAGSAAAGASDS